MKLLITGGTTFVSKFTAEHFVKNGDEVYVLNRGSRRQPDGAKYIEGDRTQLGDKLKGMRFDAVLDITAYTQEHVQALLDSGIEFDDYIFISSSAVYPETNVQPFTEEQPCGFNSIWKDYGTNKLKAEEYLKERVPNAYISVHRIFTASTTIFTARRFRLTAPPRTDRFTFPGTEK